MLPRYRRSITVAVIILTPAKDLDDLLSPAHVSRQELNLQITRLDALVEGVVADLKPDASDRQIDWQIERLPFVECDPGLIK